MKDLIDEKNRQEKMKRSIIKYWNVSYGSPEAIGGEEEEKEREQKKEKKTKKKKILLRLKVI